MDRDVPIKTLNGKLYYKEEAIQFYKDLLQKRSRKGKYLVRDDYKELVETSMMLLGETPENVSWKKPGADHKARFCAFGIYINKALAFSEQLDYDKVAVKALTRVATFITTLYVPYYMSASIGCDSPVNDLDMFKKLKIFSHRDKENAESAITVLCRHTWYLQEEIIPFALFSKKLSIDEQVLMLNKGSGTGSRLCSKFVTSTRTRTSTPK